MSFANFILFGPAMCMGQYDYDIQPPEELKRIKQSKDVQIGTIDNIFRWKSFKSNLSWSQNTPLKFSFATTILYMGYLINLKLAIAVAVTAIAYTALGMYRYSQAEEQENKWFEFLINTPHLSENTVDAFRDDKRGKGYIFEHQKGKIELAHMRLQSLSLFSNLKNTLPNNKDTAKFRENYNNFLENYNNFLNSSENCLTPSQLDEQLCAISSKT